MEVPPSPFISRQDGDSASSFHISDPLCDRVLLSGSVRDHSALLSLPSIAAPFNATQNGVVKENGTHADQEEDQNVRTLFCMMIQMQNIMKGIQENMGKLDSRVACLESEGLLRRLKPAFNVDATSSASELKKEDSSSASNVVTATPFEEDELRNLTGMRSQRRGPQYASRCTSTESSPLDHRIISSQRNGEVDEDESSSVLTKEQFRPQEETPTKMSRSQESQIPFISRRTLWKKANKPKWKRRPDLVPRLKEIVNEKFKVEESQDRSRDRQESKPHGRATANIDALAFDGPKDASERNED